MNSNSGCADAWWGRGPCGLAAAGGGPRPDGRECADGCPAAGGGGSGGQAPQAPPPVLPQRPPGLQVVPLNRPFLLDIPGVAEPGSWIQIFYNPGSCQRI